MVVGEDDAGSVMTQRVLHDFPRIDARLRERAAEKLLRFDHSVLRIEEDAEEAFVPEVLHAKAQVAAHRGGRCEAVSRFHLLRERAAGELHHGRDLRRAQRS